jgi:hypothetical protein
MNFSFRKIVAGFLLFWNGFLLNLSSTAEISSAGNLRELAELAANDSRAGLK